MAVDTELLKILIGDPDGELVDDTIIDSISAGFTSTYLAAAATADYLAAKYSRSVTFSVEGLSIQNSVKAENYRKLADRLRAQDASGAGGSSGSNVGVPVVTGVSLGEMDSQRQDTDRNPSRVRVGMDDNPSGTSDELTWP